LPAHPILALDRTAGNPIIESETATFIWQGKVAPLLIDDLHNWEENPQTMQRAGTDLWSCTLVLAADAYFEYAFLSPKTNERIPDPQNPNRVWNGINAYNNYFYMPRGESTPFVNSIKAGARGGVISRHKLPTKEFVVGVNRTVYLYQPLINTPVPLVVVHDGPDYLKRARLNVIVENMIAAKRIRPFAMALVQNGGTARNLEYSCSESTLGFVSDCVIPLAQEHLTLTPPGDEPYGVLGASLGGLMALFTGMRLPNVFGRVLSQSGAFIMPDHQSVVTDLVRYAPPSDINIWIEAGRYDWLLENNRQMFALLKEKNYQATYHEFSGGHNYTSWRNEIWRGLEELFR